MTDKKTRFKIQDRHIAFVHALAAGKTAGEAYIEFISPKQKAKPGTARSNASTLMKRPEMQELYRKAIEARDAAITEQAVRNIDPIFKTVALTPDELDAYHSAIIQGLVQVEEMVPVYNWVEILNPEGKVIKRERQARLMKVLRPPNIREKQISIDAMFKRLGSYAPNRLFGLFKNAPDNDPDAEGNVERFVLLSNGDKIPLLSEPKKAV